MIMNKIRLPKITDDLAKFDRRKKRYVPHPSALEGSSTPRQRELELLSDLQTEWEALQKKHPGNIYFVKSLNKYYRQALYPNNRMFSFAPLPYKYLDLSWLSWNQALSEFQKELYKQLTPLSQEGFDEFQAIIEQRVAKARDSSRTLKHVWQVVVKFIDYQNQHYMLAEHYYPKIIAPQPTKTNPLIINTVWVKNGKVLVKIIRAVQHHWEQTTDYSQEKILGWLIFSGIVYGGINETQMLQGWLTSLLNREYQPFINERIVVSPRFIQERFGNEREGEKGSEKLYNTKQIVVDIVSQCWLIRYHQDSSQEEIKSTLANLSKDKLEHYLHCTLTDITELLAIKPPPLSRFLYYASYYWEVLDGADIDHASVGVMRGLHNTTGLIAPDFERLLNKEYKHTKTAYDLEQILALSIHKNSNAKKIAFEDSKFIKVRKSDLIKQLTRDFKLDEEQKKKKLSYTPPTLIERVQQRCEQYTDMSEAILLQWILSLLCSEKPPKNSSILQYVKTIGYEWLYFSAGQSIHRWSEEDFETHYEDILEYKTVVRSNTTTVYAANLLQRMHDFADVKYDLPTVKIEQTDKGRRVRSELISPQAYRAIIKQTLESVDILEREMFALLFILLYRTGMRKKELLGLKFNDIEGLKSARPSLVIRPNSFRSIKTQSSVRRVPIFALLKPDELLFFMSFVQSNIGDNTNKFIFTLSSDQRPIDDHVPLDLLKQVLKDISIDKNVATHTIHGFRHTAVSNLSLVLLSHPDLVQSLTDYDNSDVLRIKQGLLGEHIDAQDRWYALSGIMGHLSPQRSFEYYNHFATLMAIYALSITDIRLPKQTLCNITNFTRARLVNNSNIMANDMVSMPSMRKLLFKNIIEGRRKSPRFIVENPDKYFLLNPEPLATDELFGRYGLNRIQLLLQTSDEKTSLNKAAQLANISVHDAEILIKRAREVVAITTKHGKPRFVKPTDLETTALSPLSIQYQSDLRLLSPLLSNAYRLREKSKPDWTWFLNICRQKLSSSKAYVTFPKKQKKELQRFVDIAKRLLPDKNWLITSSEAVLEESMHTSGYQDMQMKIKKKKKDEENKNLMKSIHIGIANRDYRIKSLKSVDDEADCPKKAKWQYSPLLRFFVHMMLITDETLPIID
ncbi:site-specific integrase [Psychrobacter immobilis]|uniref:site-specific integrase n=1 Tax=Psychrobacter immobilis TaxID=498 RepID=UPI001919E3B1|nr:site-specific integrase [Psychrobacter immobilis]